MKKKITLALGFLLLLALLFALALVNRHRIIFAIATTGEPPELLPRTGKIPGGEWVDDYFVVVAIDERTWAIGEPLNPQRNFNYLIEGDDRAVLFDAGAGHFDIRPVVAALTDRPVTFVPSHFHYDHVGNTVTFDRMAVVDLPHLREQADGDRLTLTWKQHLGSTEGVARPTFRVDAWLRPGSMLDLGGRELRVLYTPGHTDDSISLLDAQTSLLFAGDFIYPGDLYGFMPNSNLGDYLQAAGRVLEQVPEGTRLAGAHAIEAPGMPLLELSDVADLRDRLLLIREGKAEAEGAYPVRYRINARLSLLAEPAWLQDWAPRYTAE